MSNDEVYVNFCSSLFLIPYSLIIIMNIHWLQHVPFEGLGSIDEWVKDRGHHLSCTRLFQGELFPEQEVFDLLIVMGGPMGIYDDSQYPWLQKEKDFIKRTIQADKPVLGICLGAQLIADVLGVRVVANEEKEIGWFPVTREQSVSGELESILPEKQTVFHWHGDTFNCPDGSQRLYTSEACENQAFIYGDKVLGLQFHLETTPESRMSLIGHCRDELMSAPWIQTEKEMMSTDDFFFEINTIMNGVLDYLLSTI